MLRAVAARAALVAAITVAGACGAEPASGGRPAAPPSAAELVADAQRALRDAGTGHYDHSAFALVDEGDKVAWQHAAGDYDLPRQAFVQEHRLANGGDPRTHGWSYVTYLVSTANAIYTTQVEPVESGGRRWHRVWPLGRQLPGPALHEPGRAPPVDAVLAFRPAGIEPDDDGDTWTVSGTLPVPIALELVAAFVADIADPSQIRSLRTATGSAGARLVVGHDRTVRELLVAGVDIEVTSAVPEATLKDLPRQSARTTFTAFGKQVTVRTPPADEITDDPPPMMPPSP